MLVLYYKAPSLSSGLFHYGKMFILLFTNKIIYAKFIMGIDPRKNRDYAITIYYKYYMF